MVWPYSVGRDHPDDSWVQRLRRPLFLHAQRPFAKDRRGYHLLPERLPRHFILAHCLSQQLPQQITFRLHRREVLCIGYVHILIVDARMLIPRHQQCALLAQVSRGDGPYGHGLGGANDLLLRAPPYTSNLASDVTLQINVVLIREMDGSASRAECDPHLTRNSPSLAELLLR